ncbi:DNA internalization-related competence protein ComEC/Rec2 [Aestuariirhabdus litorea]|nr:DNA internalization-related competence protein ComEC/Rec2 [Aestuariirhabdus litorea]
MGVVIPLLCSTLAQAGALGLLLFFGVLLLLLASGGRSLLLLPLSCLLLGNLYGTAWGHWALGHRPPPALMDGLVNVEARIDSVRRHETGTLALELSEIESLDRPPLMAVERVRRLRLSWFSPLTSPAVGERWRFAVRLKPIRGFASPGSFDYSGQLLRNGIDARGYIPSGYPPARVAAASGLSMAGFRERLGEGIERAVPVAYQATAHALMLGDSRGFSQAQWEALRRSGTLHLMVVSGLHITLFAGAGFLLARLLIRLAGAGERIPFYPFATLVALLFATLYAFITGFALPAQRALTMLTVPLVCALMGIRPAPGSVLACALLLVLLVDPLAPISAGFWFSFITVAALMLMVLNRPQPQRRWSRALYSQLTVFLVVILVASEWGGNWSPVAPLVNLLAIPLVGLLLVPLMALMLLITLLVPALSPMASSLIEWPLWGLWWLIDSGAQFSANALLPVLPLSLLGLGTIAVILVLLPATLQLRPLVATMTCLALVGFEYTRPSLQIDVLDVGQGLSVAVHTPNHLLLFDTGMAFSPTFSAGNAVVLPYLREMARARIDRMVISHDNLDHQGGARHIIEGVPVGQVLAGGNHTSIPLASIHPCLPGEQWIWDRVKFSLLWGGGAGDNSNDQSCVLLIESEQSRILLTGDIGERVERVLLDTLKAKEGVPQPSLSLLVVPHHGSANSSSWPFVKALRPSYAAISAGYQNRFGHPHPAVVERYQQVGARLLNTAISGTLSFIQTPSGGLELQTEHRLSNRHYWW